LPRGEELNEHIVGSITLTASYAGAPNLTLLLVARSDGVATR
jgi:hypothetical protein